MKTVKKQCKGICFWCGNESGKTYDIDVLEDEQAPEKGIFTYDPCQTCEDMFSNGVQVIGITEEPVMNNMPPITEIDGKAVYPTGSFFLASNEWTAQFLTANGQQEMVDDVLNAHALIMPNSFVEETIKLQKEQEEAENETT